MKLYIINKEDNVAVVVKDIKKDEVIKIDNGQLIVRSDIKAGHKIALKNIMTGQAIIKYGIEIGLASEDIKKGDWVHSHNVFDNTEDICNAYAEEFRARGRK